MGGDGSGGPYNWSEMPLVPDGTTSDIQRQAIGRLLHDAGATVNMAYTPESSGADSFLSADALKNTFGYGNAIKGYNSGGDIPATARNAMVNPNLDAGLPVLFAITGSYGGHAVIGDGYGYQSGTMYHHLNMGWSGNSDLWYNLPNIDSSIPFTSVRGVVYNIYTSGSGEIVSGRIVDCAGAPASDVTVTASINNSVVASTTSNSNGIYALKGLASATTYSIEASKNGFTFSLQSVSTGTSSDYSSTTGNRWGVDFANITCGSSTLNIIKSTAGSGTVTSTPAGISCGTTCTSSFASPSSISLNAVASAGYAFTGWSGGGCSGSGGCIVNLAANSNVTATFAPVSAVFSESFSATSLPSGWTVQDNLGGAGRNWAFGLGHCFSNNTGGAGSFAIAESVCNTSLLSMDSSLISPNYNVSQYSGVVLSFKSYIYYWNNSAGYVDVSVDGGTHWTNVWHKGPGVNNTHDGPATETVDISYLTSGKTNVKVRFRYFTNNYGYYWEVDDFTLYGGVNSTPGSPTITSVKAGNNQASIYFSPPVFEGSSAITGYSAISSLGITAPMMLIPITVSGLINGVPYTFTVAASNTAGGSGAQSAQSNIVTPGVVVNFGHDERAYQTVQSAYDAGTQTAEIKVFAGAHVGPFLKSVSDTVTVKGGYDAAFLNVEDGKPSVLGPVTLKDGKTIFQNVVIRP